MKRKSRRAKEQKVSPLSGDLELIEPDAAAVDVGSRSHWVAVNPQRDPNPVREFGTFTADLMSLVDWLAQCGAKSVVMEATGVYWVSLYDSKRFHPKWIYEAKYQATKVQYLRAQAAKLGMVLLPKQPAVAGALT
jgi:hypothetical protein